MTSVFVLIICVSVIFSPLWIWLIQADALETFGPTEQVILDSDKRRIRLFSIGAAVVATVIVLVAMSVRAGGVHASAGGVPGAQEPKLWILASVAAIQLALMGWLIAVLP